MSDTPRTDEAWKTTHTTYELAGEMKRLERELNSANDRIKRLEEAGNTLVWYFCPIETGDLSYLQSVALKQWNAAKEEKT